MPGDNKQTKDEVSSRLSKHPHTYRHTLTHCPQGEKQFSIQPINESGAPDSKFAPFSAHPGPAQTNNMPPQEGTKEDRQAKKEALNK